MLLSIRSKGLSIALAALVLTFVASPGRGQQKPAAIVDTLPDGAQIFDSTVRGPVGAPIPGPKFRVVPMKGLSYPWALAFLPDGSILITERAGRLRIVRNGVLDPQPIGGIPAVLNRAQKGLNDIAIHPNFAQNHWVYFTYYKLAAGETDAATATLARGRFDGGHELTEVRGIFSTETLVNGPSAA